MYSHWEYKDMYNKNNPTEQLIRKPIAQQWKLIRALLREQKKGLPAQKGKNPKRGMYGQSNN